MIDGIKDAGAAIDVLRWILDSENDDYEICLVRGESVDYHPFALAARALGLDACSLIEGGGSR